MATFPQLALDSGGTKVHPTNVTRITRLDIDEPKSEQPGHIKHVHAGDILVIICVGDWDENEYDAIIDYYEAEGWTVGGSGTDWWDHSIGDGYDVFVLRMEQAE